MLKIVICPSCENTTTSVEICSEVKQGKKIVCRNCFAADYKIVKCLEDENDNLIELVSDISICTCKTPEIIRTVHPLPDICMTCRKAIKIKK